MNSKASTGTKRPATAVLSEADRLDLAMDIANTINKANAGAEDQGGKKVNGTLGSRTSSSSAKSVPAKMILRKNSSLSSSNPTIGARVMGKTPQVSGSKPIGLGNSTTTRPQAPSRPPPKHKMPSEPTSSSAGSTNGNGNSNAKPLDLVIQAEVVISAPKGNGPSTPDNPEMFNATIPMPNNYEALNLQNQNGERPVAIVVINGDSDVFNNPTEANVNGNEVEATENGNESVNGTLSVSQLATKFAGHDLRIPSNSSMFVNTSDGETQSLPTPTERTQPIDLSGLVSVANSLGGSAPHLQFCKNPACAKLHFCLAPIPVPVPPGQSQSTPLAEGPTRSHDGNNKALGLNGTAGASSEDSTNGFKQPLPIPGIEEALDHLHGLRNFAVYHDLLSSFQRYKAFAEIEALVLERVHKRQGSLSNDEYF